MVKNHSSLLSQNTSNFLTEKITENHFKKLQISRTMEWLQIPEKTQKNFSKNFLNIDIDYLQYTCYNIAKPLEAIYNILGFDWKTDQDNSNIEYNYNLNLSLQNIETRMWNAYILTFISPGFPPIPIASIEVYNPQKKWVIKTQGKIVFYGGYFVFRDIIADEAPEVLRFANAIELGTIIQIQDGKNKKPVYKRTRVDIALDVQGKISQRWLYKYIKPSKNSKHVVKPYNYSPEIGGFQSFGYIPGLSKYIWIRIYNKVLDIQAKKKQCYHPSYGTTYPDVTRIEIIYGGETATQNLETLINYTKYRILGNDKVIMKRLNKPKSQYSPLSAYEYFKRYAKNHGKSLKDVLDDVMVIAITEEQKDLEMKQGKYQEIEIFERGSNSFSSKK